MILIEDLHRLFDLIVDKTASPYFTSKEKDDFLNRGIMALVNKYFNPTPTHLMEATSVDVTDLMELIPTPITLSSSTDGDVTFADIDIALADRKFMYILNVARRSGCGADWVKCRFVRHNDYFPQISNAFKKPVDEYPIYRLFQDRVKVDPKGSAATLFTVLLEPLKVTLDDDFSNTGIRGANAVDCELSNKMINEIIFLSLQFAGISIRETEFYQMVQNEGSKAE